jgi:5-methylthioadenosine/S-adenosylhomocysteine deaminase
MDQLCITGGTVLAMDRDGSVIPDGMVCTQGPRITYCGPRRGGGAPEVSGARRLDARGGLILPGLINGHTHAAMSLFRGMADDLPLERWLTEHIFPAEQRLSGEAVYWGALLSCAEMIKGGVTSFCDMYLFARQTVRAADQAGLRAVIGEVIYDFDSPSYGPLEKGLEATRELVAGLAGHPRLAGAVMPHAAYTCAPELLVRAAELARELDADLNIHLAETKVESARVLEMHGRRPVAHLDHLGLLGPRLWIDHGVDLEPHEIARLAEAGVRLAHCPESNLKLASGVAPLPALLDAGVAVGLGTDGSASNNDQDLFGEMDTCAKVHKVHSGDPTVASAETVLSLATRLGGRAFGRQDLGTLAEGFLADVIVVDADQPHLTPMFNPVSQLVYAARGSDVLHTVCHGRVLMEDRRLTGLDEAEIMARAAEEAARLNGLAG